MHGSCFVRQLLPSLSAWSMRVLCVIYQLRTMASAASLFALLCLIDRPSFQCPPLPPHLKQVFNIIRALALKPEAGLCGASLGLAAAASECLSCGLVDAPVILSCLRSVSLSLDASTNPDGSGKVPAQDTCLGAAGLVVACEGKVVLPPGFAESMFESLRKATAHRRGANSGVRVASLLALASLVGCPLLGVGELAPRRMRVTSIVKRRMAESLLQDVVGAMDGTSLRPKNAAARVWGCMSALGQDERSVGDERLQMALGWTQGGARPGTSHGGGGGGGGGASIKPDALSVAREGTLMNAVLAGLQSVAAGADDVEGGAKKKAGAFVPVCPSLFAASAMVCLERCSALRVPHPQVAVVIEALFRGGHGVEVQKAAVQMALALADKDQAYCTWLRGLFQEPLFANLPRDVRRQLVSVADRVFLKLPPGMGEGLLRGLWDALSSGLFSSWSGASVSDGGGVVAGASEELTEIGAFLSGMGTLAAEATDSGIESIATTSFLPSILRAFSTRRGPSRFDLDGREAPLWDGLVGLLARLPWKNVQDAIAIGSPAVATERVSADKTLREYLTSRLAPVGEARNASAPGVSSPSLPAPAAAAATAKVLGSVARWATRKTTERESSTAVLPRLAERLKSINATAAGGRWLLALLDTAELPESCPMRAAALVGGATAVWESSNTGFLIVGERGGELLGRGMCGSNHRSALFYSMSVAAPLAVVGVGKASPDMSSEVLARLFRLSALLHRRAGSAADEDGVAELEEVRCGLEGFIRGLRHTSAVLNGTLSRSFASYAESVATKHALTL